MDDSSEVTLSKENSSFIWPHRNRNTYTHTPLSPQMNKVFVKIEDTRNVGPSWWYLSAMSPTKSACIIAKDDTAHSDIVFGSSTSIFYEIYMWSAHFQTIYVYKWCVMCLKQCGRQRKAVLECSNCPNSMSLAGSTQNGLSEPILFFSWSGSDRILIWFRPPSYVEIGYESDIC